jgi:hypothetical protein
MNPTVFSILLTLVKLGLQIHAYLKQQRDKMNPDQRAAHDAAIKTARLQDFDRAGTLGAG